jgi:hypothetical protein
MFKLLEEHNINVNVFRADSASYQLTTISTINKHVDKFYIKAVVNETVSEAIKSIDQWTEVKIEGKIFLRGSTRFTPFKNAARRLKQKDLLKEYRLVVTKEPRRDGQINIFTGESYIYSPILTNDFEKTNDEVVKFYNQRGKQEREFDVLKNDFAWSCLPFSKIEQNTVFMILTAMCRNIYDYIIRKFSSTYKMLQPYFRIKKFIFRFICLPAKWIVNGRQRKLRIYGDIAYKT